MKLWLTGLTVLAWCLASAETGPLAPAATSVEAELAEPGVGLQGPGQEQPEALPAKPPALAPRAETPRTAPPGHTADAHRQGRSTHGARAPPADLPN